MANIVLILFVELVILDGAQSPTPKGDSFVDRKAKYLVRYISVALISEKFRQKNAYLKE